LVCLIKKSGSYDVPL